MATYIIEALKPDGTVVKKIIELENENEISNLLTSEGLILLNYKKTSSILNVFKSFRKKKVKPVYTIEFLENFHLVIKSGVPLSTGIRDLAEDVENKTLKQILTDIYNRINTGESLYKAFSNYKSIFSDVILTLIKIGEETGNLEKVLKDAANYLKRIEDLKAKTKQALIYPAFTFFAVFGAMTFWMVYVLPKMIEAFQNFNIELPITTKILIAMSNFTKSYILHIVFLLISAFIILKILRKTNKKVKFYTDKIILRLPILGLVITYFNYAFISEYLRLMISSGVSISRALEILGESLGNEVFKNAVIKSRENLISGEGISESFKKQGLFSSMIIRMLNIGENTGRLEEQLEYISNFYYDKVDYISQNIAKMIEPLLISILGIFMLIIILGLIGPIYDLISTVNKT